MKIKFAALFFILFSIAGSAQEKSKLDIDPPALHKALMLNSLQSVSYLDYKNSQIEMTMLSGGYFTFGTTSGISTSTLDDNCQLTFGHPYAMTSYPVFSIDGQWYKPEDYFLSSSDMTVQKNGDTLKLSAVKSGVVSITFTMYYKASDQSIKLTEKIKNLDSKSHSFGLGLIYDPALGKNGDAVMDLYGLYLTQSKLLQASEIPSEIVLWEKSTGAKGISQSIKFEGDSPSKLIAGNWNDLYNNQAPTLDSSTIGKLYDLLLKIYWREANVEAGNEKSYTASFSLKMPDFSSQAFLRWDIPSYLAMDNSVMFPKTMSTYMEIGKNGSSAVTDGNLKLELPAELTSATPVITYGNTIPDFQKVDLTAKTIYERKITELVAKLYSGTTLIDEIHRNVLIPETPVSDTGLVVTVDTLMTSRYPTVNMVFEVLNKSKGFKISNLINENVFLYENNSKVENFSFGKDTTGGVGMTDIVFALDVTGSMGNEIDAVKKNIIEFADSLTKSGVDYQLGMVTFSDAIEHKYPFTKDVQYFQQLIGQQSATGGGDTPENSLQALLESSRFNFRPNSRRVVIWITDANYHENDSYTSLKKQTVIDSLLVKGIIVHAIGDPIYKSGSYDPVTLATGGNFYDIDGNFRDILLDISRVKSVFKYLLSYRSSAAQKGTNQITLKIRYAGLGGQTITNYNNGTGSPSVKHFSFYPNPFNPEITFKVKPGDFSSGKIKIYDILGRLVKEFNFNGNNISNIVWNAKDESGAIVGAGFYIAELTLTSSNKMNFTETAKILYLK